jgi:hypothetical protein
MDTYSVRCKGQRATRRRPLQSINIFPLRFSYSGSSKLSSLPCLLASCEKLSVASTSCPLFGFHLDAFPEATGTCDGRIDCGARDPEYRDSRCCMSWFNRMIRQSIQWLMIFAQTFRQHSSRRCMRPNFSSFRLRRAKRSTAKLVIRREFPQPNSIATDPLDSPGAWRWATNHSLRKENLAKPQGGRDARQASDGEFG